MKKVILLFLVSAQLNFLPAQVGIGTNNPNTNAILELNSSSKGFLLPRLTTGQRNSIVSPVEGLMIFNTSVGSLEVYNKSFKAKRKDLDYTSGFGSNTYFTTGGDGAWQEFTPTITGLLDSIVLYQRNPVSSPTSEFEVSLKVYSNVAGTNGSSLSGGVLVGYATLLLPANSTLARRVYEFNPAVIVESGTKYWMKVEYISSGGTLADLGANIGDVYTSNNTWVGGYNEDLLFSTFIRPVGVSVWSPIR